LQHNQEDGVFTKPSLLQEVSMLEVSESAQKEIAVYFQDKDPLPIRLFLQEGG
jgi:hypothetical protein